MGRNCLKWPLAVHMPGIQGGSQTMAPWLLSNCCTREKELRMVTCQKGSRESVKQRKGAQSFQIVKVKRGKSQNLLDTEQHNNILLRAWYTRPSSNTCKWSMALSGELYAINERPCKCSNSCILGGVHIEGPPWSWVVNEEVLSNYCWKENENHRIIRAPNWWA